MIEFFCIMISGLLANERTAEADSIGNRKNIHFMPPLGKSIFISKCPAHVSPHVLTVPEQDIVIFPSESIV